MLSEEAGLSSKGLERDGTYYVDLQRRGKEIGGGLHAPGLSRVWGELLKRLWSRGWSADSSVSQNWEVGPHGTCWRV